MLDANRFDSRAFSEVFLRVDVGGWMGGFVETLSSWDAGRVWCHVVAELVGRWMFQEALFGLGWAGLGWVGYGECDLGAGDVPRARGMLGPDLDLRGDVRASWGFVRGRGLITVACACSRPVSHSRHGCSVLGWSELIMEM